MSLLASSTIRDVPLDAMGQRKRTTISRPPKSCCWARNTSRNIRFTLLRFTARRSILLATINPNLGWHKPLGLANIWRNSLHTEHLNRITPVNSSASCNRCVFGKRMMKLSLIMQTHYTLPGPILPGAHAPWPDERG